MAGNRTLKLSILADVDNLKKGLDQADNSVQGSNSKLESFGSKAKLAFAAAGVAAAAYAGKLAIDGVKAAIEDEAAQLRLANALKNVTGATEAQIKSAESWILKTSLSTGVADDQLRPALERLTRSTKNVEEAQKLTNLALDIAKAKNISVETAANALAKANDGQTNALKRLGITLGDNAQNLNEYNKLQKALEKAQLDANQALEFFGPKSKEYIKAAEKVKEITQQSNDVAMQGIDIFGELGREFSGAAAESANTFQGKMERLKIAFDETKETVGVFILDAITPMLDVLVKYIVPAVQSFIESMGGKEGLGNMFEKVFAIAKNLFLPVFEGIKFAFDKVKSALADNIDKFQTLFIFLKNYVAPLFGGALKLAIEGIGTTLSVVINVIGKFISMIETAYNAVKKLIDFIKNNPLTRFFSGASFTGASFEDEASFTGAAFRAGGGGGGGGGGTQMTAEQQARLDALNARRRELQAETARIRERLEARQRGELFGTTNNITIGVATDPEGTARAIVDLINQSSVRGSLTSESLLI